MSLRKDLVDFRFAGLKAGLGDLSPCPGCGSFDGPVNQRRPDDEHEFQGHRRDYVWRCGDCGLLWLERWWYDIGANLWIPHQVEEIDAQGPG